MATGGRSLTVDLVDPLIETIRYLGARAERKVERECVGAANKIFLFELAAATLEAQQQEVADAHGYFGCLVESAHALVGEAKKRRMKT